MIQNLRSLLSPEFSRVNHRDLYDRGVHQWKTFLGGSLVSGIGVAVAAVSDHAPVHETGGVASGLVVAGLGAVATGIGLGGLNETGRTFRESQPEEPVVSGEPPRARWRDRFTFTLPYFH